MEVANMEGEREENTEVAIKLFYAKKTVSIKNVFVCVNKNIQ